MSTKAAPPTLNLPPTPSTSAHTLDLPPSLLLSLHQVPDRDALDTFVLGAAGGAGAVGLEDVLNELVPDESALAQSELVSLLVGRKVNSLRQETDALIGQLESDQDSSQLVETQDLIGDLLSQVSSIRDAATESEVVVRDITRDIQSLDLAKKHLIKSMTALKRFQMLVNAFDQLTRLAKSRRYRETAQALQAVKELSGFFKSFANVDRVAAVSKGVHEVQGVLRAQVMRDFEEGFANEQSRRDKTQQLTDACLVVDALGDDAKNSLLQWYSLLLLRDYRRIFGSTSEAGQLDNAARRFAWFRRVLKTHEDDSAQIFPKHWAVGAVLAAGFGEVTRDDLKSVLAKGKANLGVGILLEVLGLTTEFEREMSRKYATSSFEEIAKRSAITLGRPGPPQLISSVFEPYLGIFVDAQDQTLKEMMGGFTSSRVSISPSDNPSAVLPSSTELFYFYREALERCAKLSNRQPLMDLCRVYRKWLKTYAEEVLGGALLKVDRRASGEGRPNVTELQTACLVLNTAEYCLETTSQLEESLQERIAPEYKDRVTLAAERDLFSTSISAALLAILHEAELTIEVPFGQMVRSPWKDAEFVSSESAYVDELTRGLRTVVGVVREGLEQKKYVRSVCDKLVGLTLAKFTQTIVRCRPIPQIGAEQVLLDLQSLKACLLSLPSSGPGDPTPVPATYTRYVTRSTLKIDTLLKVIMTPETPAEEFVKHYLLLVPCQSFSDFQKVLDLKGVRRAEQNNLLDLFLARTSTAEGLTDSSFLTQLDMDPQQHSLVSPSGSGVNSPTLAAGASLAAGGGGGAASHLFGAFAGSGGSTVGSREQSRAGTPSLGLQGKGAQEGGGGGGEKGREASEAFKKLGARIGMASRLFGRQAQEGTL